MELSFPLQLVLLVWLFTAFGFNVPKPQESFPTLAPQVPSWWTIQNNNKNGGNKTAHAKVALSVLDTASQWLKSSVPFIRQYIEDHAPVQVVSLPENTPQAYWSNYKQYVSHIVVQGLNTGGSTGFVDSIVIQNHTDITGNQTMDFVKSGHMLLENVLQEAMIKYKYNDNRPHDGFKIHYQTREFPIKGDNSLLSIVTSIMYPMYFSMSVINLFLPHLVHLVTEKKEKIKSGLQMMGCSMVAYNLSWYVVAFLQALIILSSTTVLVYAVGIFKYTSASLFMTVFFLYTQSFIPIANACSLFFVEPKYASMFANLSFLVIVFAWMLVRLVYFNLLKPSLWVQLAFNLFSPFAFCEFMYRLSSLESAGQSFGWSDLGSWDQYSTTHNVLFLIIDSILYTIASLYLEKVVPTEYGTAESPVFFLKPSFWSKAFSAVRSQQLRSYGQLVDEEEESQQNIELSSLDNNEDDENGTNHTRTTGIKINHLTKVFKTRKRLIFQEEKKVVNDLSLNINANEIFALLGANGAGKTTTIRMLTGLVPPTSGTAYVNGFDISDDMDSIRKQLGICPQENLIFEKLSVQEHLRIFGVVKGVNFRDLSAEINTRLEQVNLLEEKSKNASDLSGGMKRRMCIAIALIGKPRVIILDEPTTGLDPLSRRCIWELLQETKKNCTIILTTHSMEEADTLADGGIAILKKGKLEVVGSSLFLKNHYGIGYNLQLTKQEGCDESTIENFVIEHVPEAELRPKASDNQMNFMLPYNSVARFPRFLRALETGLSELRIDSYGLTQTTLEQVFLTINADILEGAESSDSS